MNELTGIEKGQYKITTSHGTHYIFDMDTRKAMRVPAEGRNEMRADNDWFTVEDFNVIEVGRSIRWFCRGIAVDDYYTWRHTTEVVSIEKVEKDCGAAEMTNEELQFPIKIAYEELLADIKGEAGAWAWSFGEPNKYLDALLAVVELHKPDILQRYCSLCLGIYDNGTPLPASIAYPCPTIQAIQEQLK